MHSIKMVSAGIVLAVCLVSFALAEHDFDHYAYPKYDYQYGVNDHHTGDHKEASESRDGDTVRGHYTIQEADGSSRSVHYTADKHSGFVAHVTRNGLPLYTPTLKTSPLAFSASLGYGHGYAKIDRSH
ncbi:hypothetical protein B566_EDAN016714 [Ephemera danica]|nr:hypothetical protein B566_EDAN016714 [Ephemera danica]